MAVSETYFSRDQYMRRKAFGKTNLPHAITNPKPAISAQSSSADFAGASLELAGLAVAIAAIPV
jgi:hypothetical protein